MSAITKAPYGLKNYICKIAEKSSLLSEQKVAFHSCALLLSTGIFALTFIGIRNHCIRANQVVAGCNQFNSLVCCMPNLVVYICTCNAHDLNYQLEVDIAG